MRADVGDTVRWAARPAVFVLAVVVALVPAWHVSLWYDETATISGADRSLGALHRLTDETNAAQGLYYLLVHGWSALVGTSPVALRSLSAVAVGVAAVGVVTLARRSLGDATALTAGVVFALLPRVTWAGIEGRPYALTAAVAVWLTVLAVRQAEDVDATRRVRAVRWTAYGVLAGFGVALFVYLGLLVVAHGAVLLARRGRTWVGWLGAALLGAAISSPVVIESSGQTAQLGIAHRLGVFQLAKSLFVTEWFLGDTPTPVSTALRPAHPSTATLTWTVAAVALAVLGWTLAVTGLWGGPRPRTVDLRPWLVAWIAGPALVIGLYSVVVAPMYVPRYLTFAAPALAVLIAHGAANVARRTRAGAVVALVLCATFAAPVVVSQRTEFAKNGTDWSAVAAYVAAHHQPGDGVYFAPRGEVPEGAPVTTTMRAVETGYPSAFRGLFDVTAETSPAAAASLWGTSYRLDQVSERLAGVQVLWVIRRRDQSAAATAAEDATLAAAGFTGERVWSGPSSTVYRYARS